VAFGISVFLEVMLFRQCFGAEHRGCPTSVAWVLEGEVSERAKGMIVRVEELFHRNRCDCWRVGSIVTEDFRWI
jgi:hypothetical protein